MVFAVLALASAAACADAAVDGPLAASAVRADAWRVNLKDARADLAAADQAHAQASATGGLVGGFTSTFTAETRFLPSQSGVLTGAAAADAYLAVHPFFGTIAWETAKVDVSADGATGWTLGFGTVTGKDGVVRYLRLLQFWRKDADGAWKVEASAPVLAFAPALPIPAGFGTPTNNGVAGADRHADIAATTEAVLQADRDFAAMSAAENPAAAFVAFAAPTAMVLGGPSYGPEEIGAGFAGSTATLEWGPITGGAAASGDLGWTIGTATTRVNGTPVGYSKYLTIWERQPDGRWLYVADGGTSRPAD